jgi:endonuclease III
MQTPDVGYLFQEELKGEPFWMLVGCILANRAHWRVGQVVLRNLRFAYDGPARLAIADPAVIYEIVKPLGFGKRRTETIQNLASEWVMYGPPQSIQAVRDLPGCGDYAVQSWQIFIEGRRPKGKVTDHKLEWYLEQHPELV